MSLLTEWAIGAKSYLEEKGFSVRINDRETQKGSSVDLDGEQFVGTITHWKPNIFEFQFNSVITGEVILIETVNLNTNNEINSYIMNLFQARLRGGSGLAS